MQEQNEETSGSEFYQELAEELATIQVEFEALVAEEAAEVADEGSAFNPKLEATGIVTGGENNPDEEAFDPTILPDMIDAAREEDMSEVRAFEEMDSAHGVNESLAREEDAETEDEKVDFSTLSEADARAVLFQGLVEQGQKIKELEGHLQILGMSFVRILEEAGQIEEKAPPKMATVIRPR